VGLGFAGSNLLLIYDKTFMTIVGVVMLLLI
jgi:hypothetical protein